jgi:hypothetical protein
MSEITVYIRQNGTASWTEDFAVTLDTENYADIDALKEAAFELVQDGEIDGEGMEYDDHDTDETEITDDDYDADEDYEWIQPDKPVVPKESSIEW